MIVIDFTKFDTVPDKTRAVYPLGIDKLLQPGGPPGFEAELPNVVLALLRLGTALRIDIDYSDSFEMKFLLIAHGSLNKNNLLTSLMHINNSRERGSWIMGGDPCSLNKARFRAFGLMEVRLEIRVVASG